VVLDVRSKAEAVQVFEELMQRASRLPGEVRVEGVLVSATVPRGVEVLVGVVRDVVFGPTVVVGLGGVDVEILNDVSARVPPFDLVDAERMLDETHVPALLRHRFGAEYRASLDAVLDVVLAVQDLVISLGARLVEVDLNPVIALPDRAVVVDALIATTSLHVASPAGG
jgi:hypothetical protein